MPTIPHSGGKLPAPEQPAPEQPAPERPTSEQPTSDAVTISPFYHSSVNEITQPNSYTACSHYLTRRWKRELGPTGYAILTSFRDRCFFNRKTGELRDVIQVPVTDIAAECGISEKTVRRELATNKALQRFVRAQREPVPDVRRGGWHWGPNTYQVAMDDPIHPADEPELLEIVRRKAVDAEKVPEDPLARARRLATLGQSDRTQNDEGRQRSDNLTERRDNLTGGPDKLTGLLRVLTLPYLRRLFLTRLSPLPIFLLRFLKTRGRIGQTRFSSAGRISPRRSGGHISIGRGSSFWQSTSAAGLCPSPN